MYKNKLFALFSLYLLLVAAVGCGKNVRLGGRVTFDDGTPLNFGTVAFVTETYQAEGVIQSDGTYILGSTYENDGLAPGIYKVFILGSEDTSGDIAISRVASEYCDRRSTPITHEVSRHSSPKFDFQVKRPRK
ncbi:MAG: hypothetical protein ACRCUY_05625 [Thermoguttaceae bacterium]